jgi:hypothetical protein
MSKTSRSCSLINFYISLCFIVAFLLVGSFDLFAQNNTSSPYSMYGVGDLEPVGFGKITGMGGAGMALPSNGFLNNTNPASYYGLDSVSSMFEIGIFGKKTKFETNTGNRTDYSANFQYLAMGFKVKKWWGMSLGLIPYSSVGYKISSTYDIAGSDEKYTIFVDGTGGLSQLYMGNSVSLNKHLSLGFNASVLFGPLDQSATYFIGNSQNASVYATNKYYLHRFYFDYGLQYKFNIKNLNCSFGGVFSHNQYLKSKYTNSVNLNGGDTLVLHTQATADFNIPGKIGLGIAVVAKKQFTAALDYSMQFWDKNVGLDANLVNSQQWNLGFEYAPSDYKHKEYMKIMSYRLGGFYKDSYLELYGNQIKQWGVSAGLGFPINSLHSQINLTFEYGQRGTMSHDLIKEKYTMIHLGFTLNEQWFNRRKYD